MHKGAVLLVDQLSIFANFQFSLHCWDSQITVLLAAAACCTGSMLQYLY